MWTPKRIMLLVVGFVLFSVAYAAYAATALGRINTLPPLPEIYKRARSSGPTPVIVPPKNTRLDNKLQQAFGNECKELKRPIRLELSSRSMALAAEDFTFQQTDGRVKVQPLSLALFGKNKKPGQDVEINTIRSKVAYIKFDRPVHTPYDVNGSRIERIELTGDIWISNNRGTLRRDDDLTLWIPTGPLYYDEKSRRIWTHDDVHVTDERTRPKKTTIDAHGMEMDLVTEAPPARPGDPGPHKPRRENVTGVKRIVLQSDVLMHLYMGGPGIFGAGKDTKPAEKDAKSKGKPADDDRAHISIRTPGSFEYSFGKETDQALFQAPTGSAPGQAVRAPQHVTLIRHHDRQGTTEQLVCQRLDLKLSRKEQKGGGTSDEKLEIETAHATGQEVLLSSDPDKLIARGNDFYHDAVHKRTILRGEPEVEVDREDNLIHARELQLQDVPVGPAGQTRQDILALGPGRIDLADKKTHQRTTHALWRDRLVSTKDSSLPGGPHDLLVLTGAARFEDEQQGQSLSAEMLKVWLVPQQDGKTGAATDLKTNPGDSARRPAYLEALGNVVAHSHDLDIHDSSRLVVKFTDVRPEQFPGKLQAPPSKKTAAPAVTAQAPPVEQQALKPAGPPSPVLPEPNRTLPPAQPTAAPATREPPPRPIDLSARSVEVSVFRCGDQSTLNQVWTEGEVRVRQDPAKPGEDGVDITGETLHLTARPIGNMLVVTGDSERLATLSMDKIDILGPEVTIDQAANQAWVYGAGAMSMKSNTNLQGQPINRTVPLNVHWNKSMLFYGDRAEFLGDIQAEQENSRLACQQLQVFFDRPISLKEGNRGGAPARVRSLVGDRNVRVEDTLKKGNDLLRYQLLTGRVIHVITEPRDEPPAPGARTADTNKVDLTGPGTVRLVQRGGQDPLGPSLAQPAAGQQPVHEVRPQGPESDQLKLTYVTFFEHMTANNRTNTATFFGDVRVLNMPVESPHVTIDLDTILASPLPEGAFYISSQRLRVSNQPGGTSGKTNQEMMADGMVKVFSRDFQAEADHMTFNEEKDQIIFTCDPGRTVSFWKRKSPGDIPQAMNAGKVIYYRSTGRASAEDVNTFRGNN